jgi:hypothetical protein
MRPLDELARLWNDTLLRLPRAPWFRAAWSWPLAAAAGAGVLLTLAGTGSSPVPAQSSAHRVTAAAVSPANCQEQTWPYLSDACVQRDQAAPARQAKPVRVIQHDPAMAKAAIGATEWSRRAASSPKQQASRQKHKSHQPDRSRTVTVRPGRKGRDQAPQRVYVVPSDSAYRAYGYAPR